MVEYKMEVEVLREQFRTLRLMLEERVEDVYRNMTPRVTAASNTLGTEADKAQREDVKLQVQLDQLAVEQQSLSQLLATYSQRLETLEDTIGN